KALVPFGSRIHATRLKLLQFVAVRPWLLPVIESWSNAGPNEQPSFEAQELRRGFLGDDTYDRVVSFLVARNAFECRGAHLIAGKGSALLTDLSNAAKESGLFERERQVLQALVNVRITNHMLEGA